MSLKKIGMPAALAGAIVLGASGGSILNSLTADAATTSATATPSTSPTADSAGPGGPGGGTFDPSKGGHTANGITETVLTGDDATKATAAAKAAVPGGTVDRVETDAEGAKYEAHVTKSNGTRVTVKMDANFKVTSTDDGMR